MALISELPILGLAMEAEEKHGQDVHMAIEVVLKEGIEQDIIDDVGNEDYDPQLVGEDDVYWWVEFEDQIRIFDKFVAVRHYLLEEAVKTGEGPKVVYSDEELNEELD